MTLKELKSICELWETLIEQRAEIDNLPESERADLSLKIEDYERLFGNITNLKKQIKKIEMKTDEKNVSVEQKPRGRAAALAAYRAANPDLQDEPDEDTLHDFHGSRYAELEEKYGKLNEPNTRMAEAVAKDPRLAASFSMLVDEKNPKSLPYAIGSIYGKEWLDGDLDEFEAGYQENLKRLAESKKLQEKAQENIKEYEATMMQYVKDNELTEDQASEIHNGIMQLADNLLMGIIPVELIDLVRKGLNYEKDVQEAADTGFVEGKNEAVNAKLKKPDATSLPDLGNGSGAGKNRPRQHRGGLQIPGKSHYDEWDD
ncbi:MAG: hypothetical protein LBE71_02215 [Dysgonamonadaceae bacterium]|jgi:hypothetical protein|nr:hypothetical protein [Dysgonamonadaceae bacterium]